MVFQVVLIGQEIKFPQHFLDILLSLLKVMSSLLLIRKVEHQKMLVCSGMQLLAVTKVRLLVFIPSLQHLTQLWKSNDTEQTRISAPPTFTIRRRKLAGSREWL